MAESKPSTSEAAGDAGAGLGRSLTGRSELPAATSSGTQHTRQRSNANRPALEANAGATTAGAAATVKKPQPAVYWNDKKSMDQQRTFFSDSTPPPSPSYAAASNNSASTGYPSAKGAAAAKDGDYDYRYDHVAPPAPIPSRSKRVTKRRLLWGAVGVAIVIIALAIGLGVGLTRNKGSSRGGSDEQDSANASSTSSTVPSATSTAPEETTTVSSDKSSVCPAANNTLFDVPGSEKTFLRLCGVDYSGDGSAEDLATVWTASVQDCIINCAGYDGCTACSWGIIAGDSYKDNHRCFLKTNLKKSHKTRAGWDFAILQ